MAKIDPNTLTLEERVVSINRVAKVVKGGRRFSFQRGCGGGRRQRNCRCWFGARPTKCRTLYARAPRMPRRTFFRVPLVGSTIPHGIMADYGSARIMLKPASPGTGVIAGGSVRALVRVAGIKDILTRAWATPAVNVVPGYHQGASS